MFIESLNDNHIGHGSIGIWNNHTPIWAKAQGVFEKGALFSASWIKAFWEFMTAWKGDKRNRETELISCYRNVCVFNLSSRDAVHFPTRVLTRLQKQLHIIGLHTEHNSVARTKNKLSKIGGMLGGYSIGICQWNLKISWKNSINHVRDSCKFSNAKRVWTSFSYISQDLQKQFIVYLIEMIGSSDRDLCNDKEINYSLISWALKDDLRRS